MRDFERRVALHQIDQAWVFHLANMEYLREGIGLRGYAQVDPLVAYKKEALELFEHMQAGIQADIARTLFTIGPPPDESSFFEQISNFSEFLPGDDDMMLDGAPIEGDFMMPDVGQNALLAAAAASAERVATTEVGPNDPCPCGSGKKYKNCHRNR